MSDPTAWNPRSNWGPFWEAGRYSAVVVFFCEVSLASYLPFSELELSELLVGLQTCRWLLIPLRADGPKRRGPLGCLQGPVPGVLGRLELDGTRWRRF